jgi:hypothetical protein
MSEENRKAFEAWAQDNGFDLSLVERAGRVCLGEYEAWSTRNASAAWQAATAHAQARTCKWERKGPELWLFATSCGELTYLSGSVPTPKFCADCGGKVEVVSE